MENFVGQELIEEVENFEGIYWFEMLRVILCLNKLWGFRKMIGKTEYWNVPGVSMSPKNHSLSILFCCLSNK